MYWKTHLFYCSTVTLTLGQERLLPYKAFETITQLFAHLDGKDVNAQVGIHLQRFEKKTNAQNDRTAWKNAEKKNKIWLFAIESLLLQKISS